MATGLSMIGQIKRDSSATNPWSMIGQSPRDDDITLLVAAIDFGTTFTGYAFSTISKQNKIIMNKNWGGEFAHTGYQTPTCVLTNPKGEFDSFGYQAEHKYLQLSSEDRVSEDGSSTYNIFRNFKMLLHDSKITTGLQISSTTGTKMLAVDIFAMALKYLKQHMKDAINNSLKRSVEDSEIQWVLTVPAIWEDDAKQFMREACYKAKLIRSHMSRKLIIALEPEAASVYCQHLDLQGFHGDEDRGEQKIEFGKNENYMIIDAGGGTVDITCHYRDTEGRVREICAPSGGPWGGIYVDANFENLLMEIFSTEFIEKFKVSCPRDWKELFIKFEKIKASVKPSEPSSLNIILSHNLGREVKKHFQGKGMDKMINAKKDIGVSFRNGTLVILYDRARELFMPVINKLVEHLKHLQKNHLGWKRMKYVLLVGGFAQSELLQKAVKKLFEPHSNVLVPIEPQLAIVKGSVMFGHTPSSISSRVAKVTYGIEVMKPFDEDQHDLKYQAVSEGRVWCTNLFKPIITKGDTIERGTEKSVKVGTNDESRLQGFTEIDIFSTERSDVKYTTGEIGIFPIAKLRAKHTESTEYYNTTKQAIDLVVTFGGTELIFKAKAGTGDTWVDTSVSFSSQ